MTKTRLLAIRLVLPLALLVILGVPFPDPVNSGDHDGVKLRLALRGFEEVPAVSTGASGKFRGEVREDGDSITYTLSYSGIEGDIRQAHIHIGQQSVNGGIVVFLCQTTFNPDPTGLAPTCPQSGTVTGTLRVANMTGLASAQGIATGEFAELVKAIRTGVTYANVHSTKFPGGEIRGQIKARHDDDD